MLLELWIHQCTGKIGSFFGVFEGKSGMVTNSQLVNNQVKTFGFFVRWLEAIKHLK